MRRPSFDRTFSILGRTARGRTTRAGGPVVARVAALNLGYFGIEFAVALAIDSVSLFADSIDFLEDSSINLLILLGLGWYLHTFLSDGRFTNMSALMLSAGILVFLLGLVLMAVTVTLQKMRPPSPTATSCRRAGR